MSGETRDGSRVLTVGSVRIACMAPEARDLLDRAMDGWRAHLDDRFRAGTPMPNDPAYSFAYWLFRYSGLVVAAPEHPDGLCSRVDPSRSYPDVAPALTPSAPLAGDHPGGRP